MGDSQSEYAKDVRDWLNWEKNLTSTDQEIISIMKKVKYLEINHAFTKDQFNQLESVQNTLMKILPESSWEVTHRLNEEIQG